MYNNAYFANDKRKNIKILFIGQYYNILKYFIFKNNMWSFALLIFVPSA